MLLKVFYDGNAQRLLKARSKVDLPIIDFDEKSIMSEIKVGPTLQVLSNPKRLIELGLS